MKLRQLGLVATTLFACGSLSAALLNDIVTYQ